MSNGDWRNDLDDEGFPVANEDRVNDLFIDEYDGCTVVYYCTFIEGEGWVWKTLGRQ